ncbi:MAG: hypothetical protein ACI4GD_02115 [Lachnospiraceae bacterium]
MAGRKPLKDDRKTKPVTMYVTEEELARLDEYISEIEHCSSRAWFIYRIVKLYIEGRLKDTDGYDVLTFPEGTDEKTQILIKSIFSDKDKFDYLTQIISDSKKLTSSKE